MGNIVMGKDISTLTQEEKNALMAEMRSKRKNGNGRSGYKNPNGLIIQTNNFPIPGRKRKPGEMAKFANEHIKCVFVCPRELYPSETAYKQTKIYFVGFLSDSNKFSFEEFRESPPKQVSSEFKGIEYRLLKYCQLFQRKNIDKDTTFVLCKDDIKSIDFMPSMLKFIWAFSGCDYLKVSKAEIAGKLIREYRVKKLEVSKKCKTYKPRAINNLLQEIYFEIVNMGICPWITQDTKKTILALSQYKKHSQILVSLGLFYSVIVKFRRIESKKLK